MRISAALERGTANDPRRYARHSVHIGGGLGEEKRPSFPVTVVDLSTHGAGLELRTDLVEGTRMWLKLPGLQSWACTVVWSRDGRAGVEFVNPLHEGVVARYTS